MASPTIGINTIIILIHLRLLLALADLKRSGFSEQAISIAAAQRQAPDSAIKNR